MLALVTCHISPLNLIRKKINSWHLTSRLTARSLSELDRECILGKVFFPLRGGGSSSSSTRPPPGQNRVRTALGPVRTRVRTVSPPVRTRVRAYGPRVRTQKACFFSPGGVRVRVRVRRGRRQVKIEFELLWGEFEREFELCHRQFELEFEHVDRESGLRKLGFFFRGRGGFQFGLESTNILDLSGLSLSKVIDFLAVEGLTWCVASCRLNLVIVS